MYADVVRYHLRPYRYIFENDGRKAEAYKK